MTSAKESERLCEAYSSRRRHGRCFTARSATRVAGHTAIATRIPIAVRSF
jgi:hypothetical protein